MISSAGINSIFSLPTACPFVTTPEPFPIPGDVIAYAKQLIEEFYACKHSIQERDALPQKIHYLLQQLPAVPNLLSSPYALELYYIIATLQVIYICLTQVHLHFLCKCPTTFRGQVPQKHHFYDHLYQLALILAAIRFPYMQEVFVNSQSENIRMQRLYIFMTNSYLENPILESLLFTLLPWVSRLKTEWDYSDKIVELANILSAYKTKNPLYVRYVNYCDASARKYSVDFFPFHASLNCNNMDFRGSRARNINIPASRIHDCDSPSDTTINPVVRPHCSYLGSESLHDKRPTLCLVDSKKYDINNCDFRDTVWIDVSINRLPSSLGDGPPYNYSNPLLFPPSLIDSKNYCRFFDLSWPQTAKKGPLCSIL